MRKHQRPRTDGGARAGNGRARPFTGGMSFVSRQYEAEQYDVGRATMPGTLRWLVHVVPGLEEVVAREIAEALPEAELAGAWRRFDARTSLLEYRSRGDAVPWLELRTAEDVFALAARARGLRADYGGLGELAAATLRSKYLDQAVRALASVRRKPPRSYRVVARCAGDHAYRRVDAQRALEGALHRRLPELRLVDDDADAEFWLTIIGHVALTGVRLSTYQMRGHGRGAQKFVSLDASLKPSVARAMVYLSAPSSDDVVLDPLCGAGTLLVERAQAAGYAALYGGDRDAMAVASTRANARAAQLGIDVRQWDALDLPVADERIDVVLTNPPFGKNSVIAGDDPDAFYGRLLAEVWRVLRPGGRLVLLTSQVGAFNRAARALYSRLVVHERLSVLVRGGEATIFVALKLPAAASSRLISLSLWR